MDEGTPVADYATFEDVVNRWRPLSSAEQTLATTHIGDAAALLRRNLPDLDERIAADNAAAAAAGRGPTGDLARAATAKVAWAVKRYMENPQGAKQLQRTIGPRSLSMTLPDGSATGVFFTDDELRELQPTDQPAEGGGMIFGTTTLGLRPGWSPHTERRSPGWWPTG